MSTQYVNISTCGKISSPMTKQECAKKLSSDLGLHEGTIDKLLSGDELIIKKNVSLQEALEIQHKFSRCGLNVTIIAPDYIPNKNSKADIKPEKQAKCNREKSKFITFSIVCLSIVTIYYFFLAGVKPYSVQNGQINFENSITKLKDMKDNSDYIKKYLNKKHELNNFTGKLTFQTRSLISSFLGWGGIFSKPRSTSDLTPHIMHKNNYYYIKTFENLNSQTIENLINSEDGDPVLFSGVTTGERSRTTKGFLKEPEWEIQITDFQNNSARKRKTFQQENIAAKLSESKKVQETWASIYERLLKHIETARKTPNPFAEEYFLSRLDNLQDQHLKDWVVTVNDVQIIDGTVEYDDPGKINKKNDVLMEIGKYIYSYAKSSKSIIVLAKYKNINFNIVVYSKKQVEAMRDNPEAILKELLQFRGKSIKISGSFFVNSDVEPIAIVLATVLYTKKYMYTCNIKDYEMINYRLSHGKYYRANKQN